MEYVTKWVEIKATKKNNSYITTKFLFEYILTRYGLTIEIISNRGKNFLNKSIGNLLDNFMVLHKKPAPYHSQENCQAKNTKKVLRIVLTKIVIVNQK